MHHLLQQSQVSMLKQVSSILSYSGQVLNVVQSKVVVNQRQQICKVVVNQRQQKLQETLPLLGFQPFYFNGTMPKYCDSNTHFKISKISHMVTRLEVHWPSLTCPTSQSAKLWSNEWRKYGTCSESTLDVHGYFRAALTLRKSANLLKVLGAAGIRPNGSSYGADDISDAIVRAGLHLPGLKCIKDKFGKLQLNQFFLCSDSIGKSFVECPGIPTFDSCSGSVKFSNF